MPPKVQAPNKKTVEKKKDKIVEDKTFGLKNKKGAKTQKYVQQVASQVKFGGASAAKLEAQKIEDKKKKEKEKAELEELNKIFKPVAQQQIIGKDVDPKTVLCAFFKQGNCGKGAKCKFSHDLAMERKTEKRNIYHDNREADTMDTWDDAKLIEVVESKHGEKDKLKPKTDIICKYFLDALENSKYGWFWECPNGDTCIYRHALPPGYVLKRDKKKLDELAKEDQITLEELIEKERTALGGNLTKVTLESFLSWKKRKLREKRDKIKADEAKKMKEFKSGHQSGLSGRDLFTFNPDLILQDDEEADDTRYVAEKDENESDVEAHEIDTSLFMTVDIDGEITEFPENGAAGSSAVQINEDLFDPDDIPDSDEEDDGEEEETDADGDSSDVEADGGATESLRPELENLTLKKS